jgi:hypothetical protein
MRRITEKILHQNRREGKFFAGTPFLWYALRERKKFRKSGNFFRNASSDLPEPEKNGFRKNTSKKQGGNDP